MGEGVGGVDAGARFAEDSRGVVAGWAWGAGAIVSLWGGVVCLVWWGCAEMIVVVLVVCTGCAGVALSGLAVGETAEVFDFVADGDVGFFPFQYDLFHGRRGRHELVVFREGVEDGVIVR